MVISLGAKPGLFRGVDQFRVSKYKHLPANSVSLQLHVRREDIIPRHKCPPIYCQAGISTAFLEKCKQPRTLTSGTASVQGRATVPPEARSVAMPSTVAFVQPHQKDAFCMVNAPGVRNIFAHNKQMRHVGASGPPPRPYLRRFSDSSPGRGHLRPQIIHRITLWAPYLFAGTQTRWC
ncbi:hypothetical protein VUR80DRAFT_9051 [Thermomyces stellatus]